MTYRNKSFCRDGNYFLTTSDEWERIKVAAMQRGREERAAVAATIVDWIIRHLRRAGRVSVRFCRAAADDLAQRLNTAAPLRAGY